MRKLLSVALVLMLAVGLSGAAEAKSLGGKITSKPLVVTKTVKSHNDFVKAHPKTGKK